MDSQLKKLISLRIKHLREELNLTQELFAERLNVETSTVSHWENGKTFPSFSAICNIAHTFNQEPNQFFDFIKYHNSNEEIINMLLLEHLKKLPLNVKEKAIEFINVL